MNQMKLSIITVTKNRPVQLIEEAANSLLNQSNLNFEWIVVSDDYDLATEKAIIDFKARAKFPIGFWIVQSLPTEFGLCVGRNLALTKANGPYVSYLDDDNSFSSDFVHSTLAFINSDPSISCFIPRANRARGIWQHHKFIVSSSFLSPKSNTTVDELITQTQLFDSNGFTHVRFGAPLWNGQYRIYCDYEYFIQCLQTWGTAKFRINSQVLVNYCQSNLGIIGSSNYFDWARELENIRDSTIYPLLKDNPEYKKQLELLIQKYNTQAQKQKSIPAFNQK